MKREFYLKLVKRVNTFVLVLFLFSVLYYGCDEEPKVEREKLVKVYVEKTIAQSKYVNFPDSLESAKEEIFKKYNLTEKEYDAAINEIQPKSEYWDEFFKEAKSYLDSLKNAEKN